LCRAKLTLVLRSFVEYGAFQFLGRHRNHNILNSVELSFVKSSLVECGRVQGVFNLFEDAIFIYLTFLINYGKYKYSVVTYSPVDQRVVL